jgi:hypothetical protein
MQVWREEGEGEGRTTAMWKPIFPGVWHSMEWKSEASEPATPRTERAKINWTMRRHQRGRKRRSKAMCSMLELELELEFLRLLMMEEYPILLY